MHCDWVKGKILILDVCCNWMNNCTVAPQPTLQTFVVVTPGGICDHQQNSYYINIPPTLTLDRALFISGLLEFGTI